MIDRKRRGGRAVGVLDLIGSKASCRANGVVLGVF